MQTWTARIAKLHLRYMTNDAGISGGQNLCRHEKKTSSPAQARPSLSLINSNIKPHRTFTTANIWPSPPSPVNRFRSRNFSSQTVASRCWVISPRRTRSICQQCRAQVRPECREDVFEDSRVGRQRSWPGNPGRRRLLVTNGCSVFETSSARGANYLRLAARPTVLGWTSPCGPVLGGTVAISGEPSGLLCHVLPRHLVFLT